MINCSTEEWQASYKISRWIVGVGKKGWERIRRTSEGTPGVSGRPCLCRGGR